nr:MAG TPA_asm: hypothetical protein [Caudoviricetes sp.]
MLLTDFTNQLLKLIDNTVTSPPNFCHVGVFPSRLSAAVALLPSCEQV